MDCDAYCVGSAGRLWRRVKNDPHIRHRQVVTAGSALCWPAVSLWCTDPDVRRRRAVVTTSKLPFNQTPIGSDATATVAVVLPTRLLLRLQQCWYHHDDGSRSRLM